MWALLWLEKPSTSLCVRVGRMWGSIRPLTTFLIGANDSGGSSVRYVNGISVAEGSVTDASNVITSQAVNTSMTCC